MAAHFNRKTLTNSVIFCGIKSGPSKGETVTCFEMKIK
jgi:hypothetical protein